jgi:hypothetical protein
MQRAVLQTYATHSPFNLILHSSAGISGDKIFQGMTFHNFIENKIEGPGTFFFIFFWGVGGKN